MRTLVQVLTICSVVARIATGQSTGDANANGYFDASDFIAMTACLQGPTTSVSAGCEVFDILGTGHIDVGQALGAQPAISPPTPSGLCTRFDSLGMSAVRGYNGQAFRPGFGLGVYGAASGMFFTPGNLCGAAGATNSAFSYAYTGCADEINMTVARSAQIGYQKVRNTTYTSPTDKTYVESIGDYANIGATFQYQYFSPLVLYGGFLTYLDNSTGTWHFFIADENANLVVNDYRISDAANWRFAFNNRVDFTGETINVQDRMPGRSFFRCNFSSCAYIDIDANNVSVAFDDATRTFQLQTFQTIYGMISDPVDPGNSFYIWDKRP